METITVDDPVVFVDEQQVDVPPRTKKLKFESDDDLFLLKEVAAENPFEDGSRWKIIAEKMKRVIAKAFTARNLRERIKHLLSKFEQHFQEWKKVSGKDEASNERIVLLEDIRSLKNEFQGSKSSTKSKEAEEGKMMRLEAALAYANKENEEPNMDVEGGGSEAPPPLADNGLPGPGNSPSNIPAPADAAPTQAPALATAPTPARAPAPVDPSPRNVPPSSNSTPSRPLKRKRGLTASVESYIKQKQADETATRRREMELEEKKFELQRRMFEHQVERDGKTLEFLQMMMERQDSRDKVILEMMREMLQTMKSAK